MKHLRVLAVWTALIALAACAPVVDEPEPPPEPGPQIEPVGLDITCPSPPDWWDQIIDPDDHNHFPTGVVLHFRFLVKVADPTEHPLPRRVHFYIHRLIAGTRQPVRWRTNISLYDPELVEVGPDTYLAEFAWTWDGLGFIGPQCRDMDDTPIEYEVTWFVYDTRKTRTERTK